MHETNAERLQIAFWDESVLGVGEYKRVVELGAKMSVVQVEFSFETLQTKQSCCLSPSVRKPVLRWR